MHRLDPRVKIIAFMAIIFCIVLTPVLFLNPLYFYSAMVLFLIFVSRLPWRFILLRPLIFLPFIVLLGLSVFLECGAGRLEFFIFIFLRSFLAFICMILLVSTTPFADLLKGFEKMRCPRLLLMIFSFMYRYFYLFSDLFMKMNRARESRLAGQRRWVDIRSLANVAGSLFVKSYETSEGVYLAMCSRGYRGQIRTVHPFALKPADYGFAIAVFVYLLSVNLWSYVYALCH